MICEICHKKLALNKYITIKIYNIDSLKDIWILCPECYNKIMDTIYGTREQRQEKEEKKIEKPSEITEKQINYIYNLVNQIAKKEKKGFSEISNELYKKYGKKIVELSKEEASKIITELNKRLKQQ